MTETVEVKICEDITFTTTTEVIMDELSNGIPCTDTGEYDWKPDKICEVDVGITCETVDGSSIDCNAIPPAESTDDCSVDVKYTYNVTNVGPTTENIDSLSRTLNGNVKDLTSALVSTELVPGDNVVSTEIVSIDICQEETRFSVSAEVDATSPSGVICEDIAEYEFDVEKICDVEVEIECVLADGSNIDCRSIPAAEDLEDCEVLVEYSYIVSNTSPTPQTVDEFVRNFNGNDQSLIGELGSTVLASG